MKNSKTYLLAFFLAFSLLGLNSKAKAHCEIPCGIYDDSLRIALIKEHITTIEKSMNMIMELSKATEENHNQMVRWIMNKEDHADKIQEIVSQYFLHQRIKITEPSDKEHYEKYVKELILLHKLAVYAMKAKQTTDLSYVKLMRETVEAFEVSYFGEHKH